MSLPNLAKQQHDSKAWEMEEDIKRESRVGAERQENCMEIVGSLSGELPGSRAGPGSRHLQCPLPHHAAAASAGARLCHGWLYPHFRFCAAQEAEEADQCAVREVFGLCYSGASLDDALSTMTIDRDMLRSLLMPRPKIEKPPSREPREPLKRKQPKRRPTGECFKWIAGECKQRQCKFKHKCATCGSPDHHSGACSKKSHQ